MRGKGGREGGGLLRGLHGTKRSQCILLLLRSFEPLEQANQHTVRRCVLNTIYGSDISLNLSGTHRILKQKVSNVPAYLKLHPKHAESSQGAEMTRLDSKHLERRIHFTFFLKADVSLYTNHSDSMSSYRTYLNTAEPCFLRPPQFYRSETDYYRSLLVNQNTTKVTLDFFCL